MPSFDDFGATKSTTTTTTETTTRGNQTLSMSGQVQRAENP